MTDDAPDTDEPDAAPTSASEERQIEVDGGDLPTFDPAFDLKRWTSPEGPVVGVDWEGEDLPSGADRVAFVRAAMARDD